MESYLLTVQQKHKLSNLGAIPYYAGLLNGILYKELTTKCNHAPHLVLCVCVCVRVCVCVCVCVYTITKKIARTSSTLGIV